MNKRTGRYFVKRPLCVFLSVVLSMAANVSSSQAQNIKPDAILTTTETLISSIYQPSFGEFSTDALNLKNSVSQLCITPSTRLLAQSRNHFSITARSFSKIEPFRIGPMVDENRYHRIFYWPDSRNAGERQLRKLLNEATAKPQDESSIAQKSVAVQGLPALERLLFDKASISELTNQATRPTRCHLAIAVASNLSKLAHEMDDEWSSEKIGISKRLLEPQQDDAMFRNRTEVLRSILTQLTTGMEFLIERKLRPLTLPDSITERVLRKSPFWKSNNTIENLYGNIMAMQGIAVGSGLSGLTTLEDEIQFEFRNALRHLDNLMRLNTSVTSNYLSTPEARNLLTALLSGLEALHITLVERLSTELGVHAGFNSEDGD